MNAQSRGGDVEVVGGVGVGGLVGQAFQVAIVGPPRVAPVGKGFAGRTQTAADRGVGAHAVGFLSHPQQKKGVKVFEERMDFRRYDRTHLAERVLDLLHFFESRLGPAGLDQFLDQVVPGHDGRGLRLDRAFPHACDPAVVGRAGARRVESLGRPGQTFRHETGALGDGVRRVVGSGAGRAQEGEENGGQGDRCVNPSR